jgi:succinoglycan biosynthesis protein ExoM
MRLLIAVCCFRRPAGVERLLAALEKVTIPASIERPVDVLLIDNDPLASLAPVDARQHAALSGRFRVVVELAGYGDISAARNVGLDAARDHDLVAFLDDDEWPAAMWLEELVTTMNAHDADVVVGPVIGWLPGTAPRWQRDLFRVTYGSDGGRLTEGITGNVLMRVDALAMAGTRFRSELGASGGEDQVFFREAVAAGVVIYFAARAMVHESVPPDRLTVRYALERSVRTGNTLGLLDGHIMRTPGSTVRRLAKAATWAGRGTGRVVMGLVGSGRRRGDRDRWSPVVVGACEIARSGGMVLGLARLQQQFYGHGRRMTVWRGAPGRVADHQRRSTREPAT